MDLKKRAKCLLLTIKLNQQRGKRDRTGPLKKCDHSHSDIYFFYHNSAINAYKNSTLKIDSKFTRYKKFTEHLPNIQS